MSHVLNTDNGPCLLSHRRKAASKTKRPDYVFADSLSLAPGLSSDLAVDVETHVAPAEDLLDQGKTDELFPEQGREDLVGEDFLDELVMEARDMLEDTIWGCASLGHQTVDMGMVKTT